MTGRSSSGHALRVRPAAVAGTFYPSDPDALGRIVDTCIRDAAPAGGLVPRALIVPHAGYVYSGPVAGSGYALLAPMAGSVDRVVLLGPAHYVPVNGMAVSGADAFETPLGLVPVDVEARERALGRPGVVLDDRAHAPEHSLEVQLPFLQRTLGSFAVLPFVVGRADPAAVAELLELWWDDPRTLVVVSSDLSHYLDYATARQQDEETADAIVRCAYQSIADDDACGSRPVRGLLALAARHHAHVRLLDLRSSGDTAGGRDRVVGYGAFAVVAEPGERGGAP